MKNFIEKIIWIDGQLFLLTLQEKRLFHAIELNKYAIELRGDLFNLAEIYISTTGKEIFISDTLFAVENNSDIVSILGEIKDFLEDIKTDKVGWPGSMQGLLDKMLGKLEIFSNIIKKD